MTLFEGYLTGMMAGFWGCLKDRNYASLTFFYAAVIVSAHFILVGSQEYPMPRLLGIGFYFGAGTGQLLILAASLFIWTRASTYISLLAYCAVIINVLAYKNFPSQAGIHNYYYALINTIQVLQIAVLTLLSPGAEYLYNLVTGRIKLTRTGGKWEMYRVT